MINISVKNAVLIVLVMLLFQNYERQEKLTEPYIAASSDHSAQQSEIKITILGSGTPVPSATQASTSILVQANGQNLLFDCGRGCTTRLAQLDPKLPITIDKLFLSHLHSDHIISVDDLWLNGWALSRTKPLQIWGPVGTVTMMENMRKTYALDIQYRYEDNTPDTLNGLDAAFNEIRNEGVVYREDGVVVTAFLVEHGTIEPAWGYRIDYNGRSVLISGDTSKSKNLIENGRDVDVLLHEVMSPALIEILQQTYSSPQVEAIVSHHTTAPEAAAIFNQLSPKLAVYYHTKNEPRFSNSLIDVTREIYDGPLEIGHDLMQIRIGNTISVHNLNNKN